MMKKTLGSKLLRKITQNGLAVLCSVLLLQLNTLPAAQPQQQPAASGQQEAAAKIPADQLDSLVAPIALYPDEMTPSV
jgi:hypothetical protein